MQDFQDQVLLTRRKRLVIDEIRKLCGADFEAFKNFGFAVVTPAENGTLDDPGTTEIRYSGSDDGPARLVAAYLRGAGKLVPVQANEGGADVVVVLGEDFSEVAAPATTTPTSATGGTGATTPTSTPPAPSEQAFLAVGCIGAPT